ncbi:MAG: D-alanyl-D-alanine carboxypeptidase family protein [Rhodothalassiaceae bacterium]
MQHRFRSVTSLLFLFFSLFGLAAPAGAQGFDTSAKHAILVEMETGEVLYEKAADEPFPPSSMAKMMTIYIAFEQIHAGALSLDDTTVVSDDAWRRWAGSEASLMFLGARETVSVRDLLKGIIVSSGNDAATVLAEMLAGSEDAFAEWMNDKAAELGMTNTHFTNASGWPDPAQHTTARDLARLAEHTIRDFPELYPLYAERTFTYGTDFATGKPIRQSNRNPLLYTMDGADGLKTGHTEDAGYALTASAKRGQRRLIAVLSGLDSTAARARESRSLLEYGFRAFDTYDLYPAGAVVGTADVWLGRQGKLPLVVEEPVRLTLSRRDRSGLKLVLAYDNPVPAPIAKGTPVATLRISAPGIGTRTVPVLAGADIEEVGGFGKIGAAFEYLLFGSSGQ